MLRLAIIITFLSTQSPAYVTNTPFSERLDRLYKKLDSLTIPPIEERNTDQSPQEKLYDKLEKLNSITPDKSLTDDDEEMLAAMQIWGMMSEEQLDGVVKDLQSVREDQEFSKNEKLVEDDNDEWNDMDLPEGDYPMDWYPDEEPETSSARPAVTPSAFTRLGADYTETVVSAVDPIAATNERPKILDDSGLTPLEKVALRRAAFANIATVLKTGKCSVPQPRWFTVRQLAPAANIVYMPPCVQLHRCAPDSGCCYDESEVCAPVSGNHVAIPFYLQKADGNRSMSRMLFFNHTQCACVSRETLQTTIRTRVETLKREALESKEMDLRDRQSDWRPSTEEPVLENEDDKTDPPQLRRCTCPSLFVARVTSGACLCGCAGAGGARRRACAWAARGREHLGLRDRVCLERGLCSPPRCDYGPYDRQAGRCPLRRASSDATNLNEEG